MRFVSQVLVAIGLWMGLSHGVAFGQVAADAAPTVKPTSAQPVAEADAPSALPTAVDDAHTEEPPLSPQAPVVEPRDARSAETSPSETMPARHARARHMERTRRPYRRAPAREQPVWFRGPLAAAYFAPPLAFAVDALIAGGDAVLVPTLLGLAAFAAPPLVHVAYGDASGAGYAALGMLGATGVGVLSGLALARLAPGDGSRSEARVRDAIAFGFAGYTLWALLDVSFFSYGYPRRQTTFSAAVLPTFTTNARTTALPANGVELHIAGTL